MVNAPIRIAILGAGAMGSEHAYVYGQMPDVEVVAVFSRDADHASAVAGPLGARAVIDAGPLLTDPHIDAIDICLPSTLHHDPAVAALGAGKHVFCETPMTLDMAEARRMVEAARRADRLLQVGLLMRSIAPYRHIREAVTSGAYGRLLSVTAHRLGSYLRTSSGEHKAHYSEPSTELMTFDFDFVSWLMGPPLTVSAEAVRGADGSPVEISALLRYDDGCSATVLASGLMPSAFSFSVGLRVLFESAAFVLQTDFGADPPVNRMMLYPDGGEAQAVELAGANPYQVELERFIACVRGDADPALLDAERAVEALALSIATQTALATGARAPVARA